MESRIVQIFDKLDDINGGNNNTHSTHNNHNNNNNNIYTHPSTVNEKKARLFLWLIKGWPNEIQDRRFPASSLPKHYKSMFRSLPHHHSLFYHSFSSNM